MLCEVPKATAAGAPPPPPRVCQPYLMRGICYSPTPVGEDPGYAQPYGDYFTDSYEGIWSRDIELFVNMGANTIRLYTFSTSARHTRFMDAAMEAGLTVMAVFEMGTAKETPLTPARNLNYAQQRLLVKVKAAAAHPALTAWLVGNELNGDWNEFVCNPDFEEEIIGHNCTFRDDGRAFLTAIDELCRVVRGEGYLCSTPLAGTGLPKQYGLQTRRSKKYDGAEGVFTMDSVIGWFELGAGVYSDPTSDFPRPEDANFSTPNIDFWSYNSYPGKRWWKRKCQDGSCDGTAQWWAGDCPAGLVDINATCAHPSSWFDWLARPEDCLDRTCDATCPDGACDGKCAGNGEERGHYVSFFELYYKASTKPLLITEYGIDAYETLWPKASAHESLYVNADLSDLGRENGEMQADWLLQLTEDLERHSVTCSAGCAPWYELVASGGSVMAWVDELWKGRVIDSLQKDNRTHPNSSWTGRLLTHAAPQLTPLEPSHYSGTDAMGATCPDISQFAHTPCGYPSQAQPDTYVNEEWFGLLAVHRTCANKVDPHSNRTRRDAARRAISPTLLLSTGRPARPSDGVAAAAAPLEGRRLHRPSNV